MGYRYYETADDEGVLDYDATVQYPFGYGLSYTSFEQEMGEVSYDPSSGTVSFDVTVTNAGDVAGKDVVEVYVNPPYVNGGMEKASVNLVAFDKTGLLEPGESETVSIEFDDDDMASYDYEDARAYVLEQGDYVISINADSHTVIDEQTVTVSETITYDTEDNTHDGDAIPATNVFDVANGGLEYLSRADHFANADGDAQAMMGSYNYIGNTYASAHEGLNETVLRGEWGFRGFLETDYFSGPNYSYQTADQVIRAGTDAMLSTTDTTNHVEDRSATSVIEMRRWRRADRTPRGEGAGGHLYARAIRVHVRGLISRTSQAGRPAMGGDSDHRRRAMIRARAPVPAARTR